MPEDNGLPGYLAYMRDETPFMEGELAQRASVAFDFAIAMTS